MLKKFSRIAASFLLGSLLVIGVSVVSAANYTQGYTSTFPSVSLTSTTATSTIASNLTIGPANTNYYPISPLVITTNANTYGQFVIQNLSAGASSSADIIIGADKMNDTSYYGDLGVNSSANTAYQYTGFAANDTYLYSNDANLDFATATSTGAINFFTGGTLLSNNHATLLSNGNFAVGSTTPNASFQVTSTSSNATTSAEFGKKSQNKGTCLTFFDSAGAAVYEYWAVGATSPTYTSTQPSGCQS